MIFGRCLKAAVLAFTALILLLIDGLETACGQSALDGFDPNAQSFGAICFVVQPDGKILIGGGFTTITGVSRSRIARLNPDQTLDPGFDPNANESVYSICYQSDGKILVGGGHYDNSAVNPALPLLGSMPQPAR